MNKLKQVKAIKKVFYPKWLANTVVVKKKNGKWHVCVDFTHLIKVCQKIHSLFLELTNWGMQLLDIHG